MDNLERLIMLFPVVSIIVSFPLPVLLLLLNIIDRSRLSKINSFEEFKEKMKIMIIRKLSKENAFTIDDVIKEVEKRKKTFDKIRRYLLWIVYGLLFMFYMALIEYLIKYYRVKYLGHMPSLKFPLADIVSFITLNLWLSASLFNKLAEHRATMFLHKLNKLKEKQMRDQT